MTTEYKYKTSYTTKYRTFAHFVLFAGIAGALFLIYEGGYILAWFISLMVAIIALATLSIPRRLRLSDEGVEICCISDYTHIAHEEIASVRVVSPKEMTYFVPIFASVGFFGYFGLYLNLRKLDFVKMYASKWSDFIEITDIYDDKYYISCDKCDEVVALIANHTQHNTHYE